MNQQFWIKRCWKYSNVYMKEFLWEKPKNIYYSISDTCDKKEAWEQLILLAWR